MAAEPPPPEGNVERVLREARVRHTARLQISAEYWLASEGLAPTQQTLFLRALMAKEARSAALHLQLWEAMRLWEERAGEANEIYQRSLGITPTLYWE